MSLLVLALAASFALSPFFVTSFQGIDPKLYPVPQVDPPVQPAGWAFAIWGLLYLWLIVMAGFGVLRRAGDADWQATRPPLALSLSLGTFWLAAAERSPVLATAMIWLMLLAAVLALLRAPQLRDRWWLGMPLGLYASWLTAASCAGLGLLGAGWGIGPGEIAWAYVGIALATAIGGAVLVARPQSWGYGAALIWALAAIAAKNAETALPVAGAAGLAALAVLTLLLLRGRR
ncbi:hypothetical protein [Frigidibacter sp. ROC022]|uniref:hypothetical protein n=1 Tax=Frigidibacter sp. ROC022 TaxID=2971796 RepID=UPI00215B3827|nr:hypothetical protein [Frigidibacter sp. ROC022]MCR8723918.1 hypothetical protein [Frigidibacter sp. ROC022]